MFANTRSITCVFPYLHRRCETLTNREGTCAGNSSPPCSLAGTLIPTDQVLSLWTEEGVFLLLNDKALYAGLDSTVNSANALLIDLKANPKRYVHFSVFGSKEKKEDKKVEDKK